MDKKIIITTESVADLSPELIERYGYKALPLKVNLGNETYSDGVNLDADMIYEYNARTGELPKTSALNIGEYKEFFSSFTESGYAVIHFSLSSEFSSTYNNARLAAEELEDVYVVDSHNLSTGIALLLLKASDMVKSGMNAKEIAEKIKDYVPCVDASFVIDSLEYLYKGGRCSALSVLGANLLKLKPCIEVKDGKMGVGKKYRGKYDSVLKEYIKERVANPDDIDTSRVFITHAGCDKEITDEIIKQVAELNLFDEILFTRAGCTISSHCGKNTLGILFMKKSPIS